MKPKNKLSGIIYILKQQPQEEILLAVVAVVILKKDISFNRPKTKKVRVNSS